MVPMGLLAWVVAPWLADHLGGPSPLTRSLILCLTAGLVWQFVLVLIMLVPERRSPSWPGYRKALWLNGPPRKRQWLLVPVLAVALGIEEFVPQIHHAATRELSSFFDSHAGHVFMSGSWGWLAVLTTMFVFNTVLGEELLFRGLLLPRMNGVFGRKDWLANGAPVRALPRARAVGHPRHVRRRVHRRLSRQALPQRAVLDRGAQHPERVLLPLRAPPGAELN